MHQNHDLQNDWTKLGSESFELKILDEVKLKDTATSDQIRKDLKEFLKMHKEEIRINGQFLY